jgi:nuclear pore complex protein Nup98-Nup96
MIAEEVNVENSKADRLLSLQLKRSIIEQIGGVPVAMIDSTIRFRDFAHLFDAGDRSHEANVFRLGAALFDEIDPHLPANSTDELVHRISEIRRKLALSRWLEDAVSPWVDSDLVKTDSRPGKVFAYLTGNQIDRAVRSALEGNDMRLATLLSQIGGPEIFKAEVIRQLEDWQKYKATPLISVEYRRLYALLAGITDIWPGDSSHCSDHAPDILIAGGLDWKRAFGLRLWFGNPFEDTIGDVLESFADSLKSATPPAKPLPPYLEKPGPLTTEWEMSTEPTDILYGLIRLYSNITISLEEVLRARDASPCPTDYRLPWHLYLLLARVLQKRDFEDRDIEEDYSATADAMTASYATQLEAAGEWRWAAFVMLHLETPEG